MTIIKNDIKCKSSFLKIDKHLQKLDQKTKQVDHFFRFNMPPPYKQKRTTGRFQWPPSSLLSPVGQTQVLSQHPQRRAAAEVQDKVLSVS